MRRTIVVMNFVSCFEILIVDAEKVYLYKMTFKDVSRSSAMIL